MGTHFSKNHDSLFKNGYRDLKGYLDQKKVFFVREEMCHSTFSEANFEILRPSLQLLNNLLQVEDEEILFDTCWAISYISDDPTPTNSRIQEVIANGFLPHLIRLLDHGSTLVVHPALRAVGNIVTGSNEQTSKK